MSELSSHFEVLEERLLLQELTHRVNNEFASLIGTVSLAAATCSNEEVKHASAASSNSSINMQRFTVFYTLRTCCRTQRGNTDAMREQHSWSSGDS
jgi:hypothetical protein